MTRFARLWVVLALAASACGAPVQGVDNPAADKLAALPEGGSIVLSDLFGQCASVRFLGAYTPDELFENVLGERPSVSLAFREDAVAVVVNQADDTRRALLLPRSPMDLDDLQGRRPLCDKVALHRNGSRPTLMVID